MEGGRGSIVTAVQQLHSAIKVTYSDPEINAMIGRLSGESSGGEPETAPVPYTRHFTQNEEFFIRFPAEHVVDSCPIHHDVRSGAPGPENGEMVRKVVRQLLRLAPAVFEGLTHVFDPADVFRPAFFRLYKMSGRTYLYLLHLDLHYRPSLHTVISRGSNDFTPTYTTNALLIESDFVPLEHVETESGKIRGFHIERAVSETWIGESGRGYFVQGIWLDRDITRFFSRLFVPAGVRAYPYYPFTCKYRAICHSVVTLGEPARRTSLPLLHAAREFLLPRVKEIERALQKAEFNDRLPSFLDMRSQVPEKWRDLWSAFSLRMYLNEDDQREYELERGIV